MKTIQLEQPFTLIVQPEIKHTGSEITNAKITLDDFGCVLASWNFGPKQFNQALWDENTTPTYSEIGQYTNEDIEARIIEITLNS